MRRLTIRPITFARAFCAVLVTITLLLSAASPSTAHATRMYAIGYTTGSSWGGGYAQWDYEPMTAYDWSTGGFIAQVLWVYTQSSTSSWMEVGDTQGWQGQNIRTYYWAEGWPGHYAEQRIFRSYPAQGTYVEYEIQAVFNGEYDAYVGGTQYGSSFQSGTTPRIDVGIESTSYSNVASSVTDFYWMQYRDWTCCTWNYWPNGSQHNDIPAVWSWLTNYTHAQNWTQ